MKDYEIKDQVREHYGAIAKRATHSCCPPSSCGDAAIGGKAFSKAMGYSDDELNNVPEGANLGLGCGNPTGLAELKAGEKVLDLGSGAGFDCFLAAKKVGSEGLVVGVDMTAEMISKARANAEKTGMSNVEFRLGEIEHLPASDNFFDIAISNCVINLSMDKKQVFKELYRVLKPGGRFIISDLVLTKELPDSLRNSVQAYSACIAGALLKDDYLQTVKDAGFIGIRILNESRYVLELIIGDPMIRLIGEDNKISQADQKVAAESVLSITLKAIKPAEVVDIKKMDETG